MGDSGRQDARCDHSTWPSDQVVGFGAHRLIAFGNETGVVTQVTAPSVHQIPGEARSIQLLIEPEALPGRNAR